MKSTEQVDGGDYESRTDLDSHANMVVLGKHAAIVNVLCKTAKVSPFSKHYKSMKQVPLVDAVIAYNCPHSGKNISHYMDERTKHSINGSQLDSPIYSMRGGG